MTSDATNTSPSGPAKVFLTDISVAEIFAQRRSAGDFTNIRLETGVERQDAEGQTHLGFRYRLVMTRDDAEVVADVKTMIVVSLQESAPGSGLPLDDPEAFGRMAAHPYARQILSQLTRDLGLPTVMLGALAFGDTEPQSITIGHVNVLTRNDEAAEAEEGSAETNADQ